MLPAAPRPRLGPGAVYLPVFDHLFRANADLIRVVEVEPQTLWIKGTAADAAPRGNEAQLRALDALPQPKLLHGVGDPLGGTLSGRPHGRREFLRWAEALAVPWTSEHLSILDVPGGAGPRPCGFLMPPSQTEAAVMVAAENIARRQALTRRPIAFETGVNYFSPRPGEMSDGAFFAAVAEAADCGILLDLSNLWVNARNGRQALDEVLEALPFPRVWEMHLAGAEFAHGYWLDAHSGAIASELVAIASELVSELPHLQAIVFELAPDRAATFGETAFLRQIEVLTSVWAGVRRGRGVRPPKHSLPHYGRGGGREPAAWERLIATRLLPPADQPPGARTPLDAADEASFALYARLVASSRHGAIAKLLEHTLRLLLVALGEAATVALLDAYVEMTSPALFPSDEALGFRGFLLRRMPAVPGLPEILAFEAALIEAIADDRTVRLQLARDVDELLAQIASGHVPPPAPAGPLRTLEIGADPTPGVRVVAGGVGGPAAQR